MANEYVAYATEYREDILDEIKPTVRGFIRKYILCSASIIAIAAYYAMLPTVERLLSAGLQHVTFFADLAFIVLGIPSRYSDVGTVLGLISVIGFLLAISWVLASREASLSIALTMLLASLFALPSVLGGQGILNSAVSFLQSFNSALLPSAVCATILLLVGTEIYRRSITYRLTDTDLVIEGGLWRKQEHRIPYNQIGRVVLEQSLLGRLLNYGTVIPVGVAEWGAEYYTRAVGASLGDPAVGAGYARTLKEVSRDPMKCLYGIENPSEVAAKLQKMITVPYRAEVDQVGYLRKIYDKLSTISI